MLDADWSVSPFSTLLNEEETVAMDAVLITWEDYIQSAQEKPSLISCLNATLYIIIEIYLAS